MSDEQRPAEAAERDKTAAKWRLRAWTISFMLITSFIFTSAVSLTYLSTAEYIRTNERLFLQRAVLQAAAIDVPAENDAVKRLYEKRVREVPTDGGDVRQYDVLDERGDRTGFVVPVTGAGLWGPIDAVVGFAADRSTLTGVDFTRQNETPGLGGRIVEPWFRDQFRGKRGPFEMVPERTADEGPRQFDAITGATITSTAVRDMLNAVCTDVGRRAGPEGAKVHGEH